MAYVLQSSLISMKNIRNHLGLSRSSGELRVFSKSSIGYQRRDLLETHSGGSARTLPCTVKDAEL